MMNSLSVLFVVIWIIINGVASSYPSNFSTFPYHDFNLMNREKRQSGCILPEFPANGKWALLNGTKLPGESVPPSTAVRFDCFQGFKLSATSAYLVCDRTWSQPIPECQRICSPRFNTKTTTLTCSDKDGNRISCSEATDGTQLTYQCVDNDFYESDTPIRTIYCESGEWTHNKPECRPVCGKRNVDATALSFNSEFTKLHEFPWVAAIYLKVKSVWRNACGGTLITPRVVLTAAHCTVYEKKILSKEELEIAVGKQYLEYGDNRDENAQYRKLSSVIRNSEYKVDRRYLYDIALLVAETKFNLAPEVQPVCYAELNLPHIGSPGEVAGWGITEDGRQPDHMKTLTIYHKDQIGCRNELPSDFETTYFLHDKICAGFYHQNKSLCKGDSGSGLVFLNPSNNRYYIHGIVSVAPKSIDGPCNYQDNILLTKVTEYYSWIERETTFVERCTLPPYPENGKWVLQNGIAKSPGQTVPNPTTILVFSCDPDYVLDTVDSKYFCESVRFPKCEKNCPELYFTVDATVQCLDKSNQLIDCPKAAEGAALNFVCPRKRGGQQSGTIHCNDGNWKGLQPECLTQKPQGPPMGTPKPPVIVTTESITTEKKIICTYDAQWYPNHKVIPENFNANLCTHLVYSSMGLWTKGDVKVRNDSLELNEEGKVGLYQRVADLKLRNPKLKILFSVGGAAVTDYNLFKRLVGTVGRTLGFLGSAGYFIRTYNFDGLNIDWDYPKEIEKEKLNLFWDRVREDFNKNNWLLTASVPAYFNGTGYDIHKLNEVLDWVTIKSYDLYDSNTPYTGFHNALYASSKENDDEKQHRNMRAIAKKWLDAGLNKKKLVLSIAFHGRLSILSDSDDHGLRAPIIGLGPNNGFLRYYEICSRYGGYVKVWDDEQKGPYKYKGKEWFSYNDERAVRAKAEFIKDEGLMGVNVWPLDADDVHGSCGNKQILLQAVHKTLNG